MKKHIAALGVVAVMAFWGLAGAVSAGSISGSVAVKGLRSPANILVYLLNAPSIELDLAGAKYVMDQRNLAFVPQVLPVPVGATVLFPNNDQVDHNVFSLSRAKKFNLGSYKPGESVSVVFDQPGIVELRCDVHAEMLAYILVMKSPYWALTDEQGRYAIPDPGYWERLGVKGIPPLPAGEYLVRTWHEKLKSERQTVVVPASGDVSLPLQLTRGAPSVLFK